MTTLYESPLDNPEFVGIARWLEDGAKDEPPIAARLAVRIDEDAAYSLSDFAAEYFFGDAESFGWDIRRLFDDPNGCGLDVFENLYVWSSSKARHEDWHQETARLWSSFNRERIASDKLLIDAMDECSHFGWTPPPEIAAAIERLRDERVLLRARRGEREAEEEAQHYARVQKDADARFAVYEKWIAAGEPANDPLATEHRQRKTNIAIQSLRDDHDALDAWLKAELAGIADDDDAALTSIYSEYNDRMGPLQVRYDEIMLQHNASATAVAQRAGIVPLADTQRVIAALGQPVLDEFMSGNPSVDAPAITRDLRLPETLREHALYEMMNDAIARVLSMAETQPKQFRQARVLPTLAVLYAVHPDVCERVFHRITATGAVITNGKFDSAIKSFENKVRREINTSAGFILDTRGNPAPDNSDNVSVFLRMAGKRLRRNEWFGRNEIADAQKDNWRHLDDDAKGDLLVDAENSQFNYHPSKERFHRALNKIAREDVYDPVITKIDELAAAWDGVPRLDTWLHQTCGVPDDEYHAAVSRNIVGGMIRRARHPGCKHDECAILISTQGTAKSSIAETLALDSDWFTDTIEIGGRKVDIIPEMRGKWVIELQELAGMSKTEVEKVKAFISTKKDNATLKYREEASEPPRRCIFLGTSNDPRPLRDVSGNRRFLPVRLSGHANIEWLRENVEQIIGEAAVREADGETFGVPRELWAVATEHQDAARQLAPLEEHVVDLLGQFAERPCLVASADILEALRFRKVNDNKIGAAMERLGFTQPNRHDRIWASKTGLTSLKSANKLMLRRSLSTVDFVARLAPPPY
jgi:hypothetical protein